MDGDGDRNRNNHVIPLVTITVSPPEPDDDQQNAQNAQNAEVAQNSMDTLAVQQPAHVEMDLMQSQPQPHEHEQEQEQVKNEEEDQQEQESQRQRQRQCHPKNRLDIAKGNLALKAKKVHDEMPSYSRAPNMGAEEELPTSTTAATAEANADDADDAEQTEQPKRFVIKSWQAQAIWSWDVDVDNCAICRNNIVDVCIECQASNIRPITREECNVVWGVCNHAFHYHCISRWLRSRRVCPLDNTKWEYRKYGL